jgi:hypothetical protein
MTSTANWIWVYRLDVPVDDPLSDVVHYMEEAEVTKVVDDWNAYVAGGTSTGGIYECYPALAGMPSPIESWIALDFDSITYIEMSKV